MIESALPANILVVDDMPENLRLLSTILRKSGYEVRPATSGRQALTACELDPPDLVLLDINMPEMSGYELCTELRKREILKDLPIIFLTALNDVTDKLRAFEVGGVDYITKPFHLEEVQARVKTHLALRRTRLELKQSLSSLQAIERLRDDLVHMIVHDMRSPIAVVMGHLQLAQDDPGISEETRTDLMQAIRSTQVLSRMANELLDVRRLEEGKLPLLRAEHDLQELATHAKAALANLERERAIQVRATEPVRIVCDGALIGRVLENLLSNAIKHTPLASEICVQVGKHDGRASISVLDNGPGVPPEISQKLFEKFTSAANRRSGRYHSAGLGLAFCKLAVEAHGGTIGVEARKPQGSKFWFELPGAL